GSQGTLLANEGLELRIVRVGHAHRARRNWHLVGRRLRLALKLLKTAADPRERPAAEQTFAESLEHSIIHELKEAGHGAVESAVEDLLIRRLERNEDRRDDLCRGAAGGDDERVSLRESHPLRLGVGTPQHVS